ncbi:MAG: 4-hydroxy-3-methylbut-2-enyl diphosphate reductase [bacterium]
METPNLVGAAGEILLARPRGFCAGVERAIAMVELALKKFGPPIYVKHAIVHNRHVVEGLRKRGAVFVEEMGEIPRGARVIFSAHGVSPAVWQEARERGCEVLDATCPLVTKVHGEARRFAAEGRTIFLIGHREHVEVVGTLGEAPENITVVGSVAEAERVRARNPREVACLTQTTLSLDDARAIVMILQRRFPALAFPRKDDICFATQNRQNAVAALCRESELILVVGSPDSSNSNRLVEVARAGGVEAHLVESWREVEDSWLAGVRGIGVTAGASAPEEVVQELVDRLSQKTGAAVREIEVAREDVNFALPPQLAG